MKLIVMVAQTFFYLRNSAVAGWAAQVAQW